jgi:hypothetical protein
VSSVFAHENSSPTQEIAQSIFFINYRLKYFFSLWFNKEQ